jgi:hypothetical protein
MLFKNRKTQLWDRIQLSLSNNNDPKSSTGRTVRGDSLEHSTKLYTKHHIPGNQSKEITWKLLPIVAGNAIGMACFMVTLWRFARIGNLNKDYSPWIKRAFNVATMLVTAAVSIGIGAFFDQIGYLVRWPLLAQQGHSLQEVYTSPVETSLFEANFFLTKVDHVL